MGAEVYVAETNREAWHRNHALRVDGVAENIREFQDNQLGVIVDYAGFGTTTDDAIETVGVDGTVVQVGMGVERADISTTTIMLKQLNFLGSLGGTNEDAAEVLEMMAAGKVSSKVEVIGFDDIDESIKRFASGGATRGRLVAVRD